MTPEEIYIEQKKLNEQSIINRKKQYVEYAESKEKYGEYKKTKLVKKLLKEEEKLKKKWDELNALY